MAPKKWTWVNRREPRAAAISNKLLDQYKDTIHDLYLERNWSRADVIAYLTATYKITISPDQFSKATKRWGFRKQNCRQDTSSQSTESPARSESDISTSSKFFSSPEHFKRPRSGESAFTNHSGGSFRGHQPPAKRPKPGTAPSVRPPSFDNISPVVSPIEDISDPIEDSPPATTSPSTSPHAVASLRFLASDHQIDDDDVVSAEYFACCYRYKKAFGYFAMTSFPFQQKTKDPSLRRSRMLDMARNARSPSTRNIAAVILESELRASYDPLSRDGILFNAHNETQISPVTSFLFHGYLARIYSYKADCLDLVQKHLDLARAFTNNYHLLDPAPLDLWALHFLQEGSDHKYIFNDVLDSIKYDQHMLAITIESCLEYCKDKLELCIETGEPSQMTNLDPTIMSYWSQQQSSLHIWAKSAFLFSFLWKQLQLVPLCRGELFWPHKDAMPDISATHFLMIVCRMIVCKSRSLSEMRPVLEECPDLQTGFNIADAPLYLRAIDVLISDGESSPREAKRQFVTQFLEHHSWSPPRRRRHPLVRQVETYQIECLESVLTREKYSRSRPKTPGTPRASEAPQIDIQQPRRVSFSDFLNWMHQQVEPTEPEDGASQEPIFKPRPSWASSSIASRSTASFNARELYIRALRGNPPMARSLASRASSASQESTSSSLRRFRAAGHTVSVNLTPSLRRSSPWASGSETWKDLEREWLSIYPGYDDEIIVENPELGALHEVPEGSTNELGTIKEANDSGTEGSKTPPTPPTIRARLGNFLRGKG